MKKSLTVIAALMAVLMLFTACGKTDAASLSAATPVLEFMGEEMTYGDFAYVFLSYRDSFGQGVDPAYWESAEGDAYEEFFRDYAVGFLQETAGLRAWAKELGVELTEEDYALIDADYQAAVDSYGSEEAFAEELAKMYATTDVYKALMADSIMMEKLRSHVVENFVDTSDAAVEAYADELGLVRVRHILIANDEGEDEAENKQLAEMVRTEALAGSDFVELATMYTDDTPTTIESGYTFGTEHTMMEAFAEASFALEIGEISPLVEIDDYYSGWHIIQRVELDYEAVRQDYEIDEFYSLYEEFVGSSKPSLLNGLDSLKTEDIAFKAE